MNILITYTVIHHLVYCSLCIPTNINSNIQERHILITGDTRTQENVVMQKINELEQQKNELFREINKAMEESVTALKNSNVSNAEQGVSYLENLKMEIKNIANTNGSQENGDDISVIDNTLAPGENNSSVTDTRRHNKRKGKKNDNKHDNTNNMPIFRAINDVTYTPPSDKRRPDVKFLIEAEKEIKSLLNKGLVGKRLKDRMERREKMQKMLEEWASKRNVEKQKLNKYRELLKSVYGRVEDCPRHGIGAYRKVKSVESITLPNSLYPCCRKCCKESYLGCL